MPLYEHTPGSPGTVESFTAFATPLLYGMPNALEYLICEGSTEGWAAGKSKSLRAESDFELTMSCDFQIREHASDEKVDK